MESGSSVAQASVLDGYEDVLGLTSGLLAATVGGLRRGFQSAEAPRVRKTPEVDADADFDALLEAVAKGVVTGAQWLSASRALWYYDQVFLRHDDWSALASALIRELATSGGIDHVRRFEAAVDFLRHPSSQRHVSRALGNFVMDPDAQVVAPVLNLLGEVTDRAASDLVLRLLSSPSRNLRRAATSVAATKVARGHFDAQALPELERHLERQLSRGLDLDAGLDTLDLAVHVPRTSWEAVESRLRDPVATAMVVRVRSTRELITSRKAASLATEVATAIQDATPTHHPIETDMMLHRLVREALVHTHKARRHHAALLLSASPYGPATADQVLALTHHRDEFIAARAWAMLMRLPCPTPPTGPRQRTVDAMPDRHLARVLINVGIHDRPLDPATAAGLAARLPARRRSEHHGVLFALGMHGSPELERLSEHADDGVRRAAAWWLLQGGATRDDDSAAQRGSRAN
ncbi:hypothetical protein [Nocardioides psychrotolerans]|uniref:hypothetical protein n=1 Tax=Nocardioides psychrotolerans TaxID=1005945 RepID=UPI000B846A60|nr:hypothetical protein [Nocardioides psychrotolerans]